MIKFAKEIAVIFAVAVLLIGFGCSRLAEGTAVTTNSIPSTIIEPQAAPSADSPIRSIDFGNFTYPWTKGLAGSETTFTLKNGEIPFEFKSQMGVSLTETKFVDATGDGEEDAVLFMNITTGGSASPGIVYIYSLEKGKPKLLWHFDTGDRAEGGFHDVYVENAGLVVELYGENKFKGRDWDATIPSGKDKGLCCPTLYTKARFKWNGKQFVIDGTPEDFDIDPNSNRSEN